MRGVVEDGSWCLNLLLRGSCRVGSVVASSNFPRQRETIALAVVYGSFAFVILLCR